MQLYACLVEGRGFAFSRVGTFRCLEAFSLHLPPGFLAPDAADDASHSPHEGQLAISEVFEQSPHREKCPIWPVLACARTAGITRKSAATSTVAEVRISSARWRLRLLHTANSKETCRNPNHCTKTNTVHGVPLARRCLFRAGASPLAWSHSPQVGGHLR